MTKPKKQKRFKAAYEIQAAIIKLKQRAQRLLSEAEKLEGKAWEKIKEANDPNTAQQAIDYIMDQANEMRDKAKKHRRYYHCIYENQIPKLVRTMGAMQTTPMVFLGDKAVVLQQ